MSLVLDARAEYYFDFASSVGLYVAITPSGLILCAFTDLIHSCDDIDASFNNIDAFGVFLVDYCKQNNLEFKPYIKDGRGGKRPNTGGRREGAGHPKGVPSPGSGRSPGFGKYGEEGGKLAWIPAKSSPQDIEDYRSIDSRLSHILQSYRSLALQSQESSITQKPTRDWTKAIQLINDLQFELDNLAT
jgi:hypothetical protein